MTQIESPKRKMQKKNDYQRHKLFRKIKRRRKAQAEAEQQIAEKQLRKKLKLPKFDTGDDSRMVYLRDIVRHDPYTGEDILKTGERVNRRLQAVKVNQRDLSKIDAAERNQELRDLRQYMGDAAFDKYMSDLQTRKDIQNAQYQKTWQGEAADAIDGGMMALAFNPETQPAADVYFALKGAKELSEGNPYGALGMVPILGKAAPEISNATKQAIEWMQSKVPYRFQIPTNEDTFYRILHGSEGISDANNSGMITRTFAPDYQFPYFTKGQLYSKQNPSFNFDNSVVITSKPDSGQSFHFVQDGMHVIDPKRVINVGDSATPVEISGIGNAYNSSPAENFEYWTRGNGWLTKHLWKRNQFTPFKNQRVIDTKDFGGSFAEGSESEVFNDPTNKFAVVKKFSSGYKNNPSGMIQELVRRNSVPGAMPTKMIGMSKYGYPILQQGRVTPIEEGTPWTYSLAKDAKQLFENSGYKYGMHQGVPNNGSWKIIDVSPQNLGYDSFGNLRTIDVMPDRLFNSGKDIHIKPSKRGTFTKAAKQHGMSVQGFANKVLKNPSKYSAAMRKKANFAHNAASWKR